MSEADPLAPLLSALGDLVRWMQDERIPGMVIGGVAASILGRPRVTRDIDAIVLLDEARWEQFFTVGARFGFVPRRPDSLGFARQARVLLLRHESSGIDLDIIFGSLAFEQEAVARAISVNIHGVMVPLPTPEDLAIMKAVAHRPRDMADIEALLGAQPKLDLRRVRRWVRQFSAAMEMPEVLDDLESLLARHRKRGR